MATPTRRNRNSQGNGGHGPALEIGDNTAQADRASKGIPPVEREEEREQEAILENMRELGGAGAYLRIERRKPTDSEYSLLVPRLPLESYADATKLEDYLLSTFGGGDYKLQGRTSGGKVVRQYVLKIDHSVPAKNPAEAKTEAKAPDAAAIVRDVMTQMIPLIRPPAAAAQDNSIIVAMIQASAETNKAIFTAMASMSKGGGPDPQLAAILAKMERAIEKIGDQTNSPKQKSGAAELLELLQVMREIREDSEQPEEKKSIMAQIGEAAGPIIKALAVGTPLQPASVLDSPGSNGAVPTAPHFQRQAPAAVRTVVEADPADGNQNDAMNFFVKQALATVAKNALAAADRASIMATAKEKEDAAEAFALALTPQIPEAYDDQVKSALNDPNWLTSFFGTDPRVQTHAEWLGKVRAVILEELADESGD